MSNIELFDKSKISELRKNANYHWRFLLDYFEPFILEGTSKFIENIHCEIKILKIDDILIPVVIADNNYDDCLYVSLLSHYIKYTIDEMSLISSPILRNFFIFILNMFGVLLKSSNVNKVVYINNWLISTNLYPKLTYNQIKQITEFLKKEFKDYLIAMRSINNYCYENLYQNLKKTGYKFIINRQTFIIDKKIEKNMSAKYRWKIKKDTKLRENSDYKIYKGEIKDDFERIKEVYTQLYIEKYSRFNPKYQAKFFQHVLNNPLFDLNVIKKDKKIYGMCLNHFMEKKTTAPAVGYDRTISEQEGLYRIIMSFLMNRYKLDCDLYNMSAGVGDFKIQRGAKSEFEFIAVNYEHLPLNRKLIYFLLEKVSNSLISIFCQKNICGFVKN